MAITNAGVVMPDRLEVGDMERVRVGFEALEVLAVGLMGTGRVAVDPVPAGPAVAAGGEAGSAVGADAAARPVGVVLPPMLAGDMRVQGAVGRSGAVGPGRVAVGGEGGRGRGRGGRGTRGRGRGGKAFTPCTHPSCKSQNSHSLDNCFIKMREENADLKKKVDSARSAEASIEEVADFAGSVSDFDFSDPHSPLLNDAAANWVADTGATRHMTPH